MGASPRPCPPVRCRCRPRPRRRSLLVVGGVACWRRVRGRAACCGCVGFSVPVGGGSPGAVPVGARAVGCWGGRRLAGLRRRGRGRRPPFPSLLRVPCCWAAGGALGAWCASVSASALGFRVGRPWWAWSLRVLRSGAPGRALPVRLCRWGPCPVAPAAPCSAPPVERVVPAVEGGERECSVRAGAGLVRRRRTVRPTGCPVGPAVLPAGGW